MLQEFGSFRGSITRRQALAGRFDVGDCLAQSSHLGDLICNYPVRQLLGSFLNALQEIEDYDSRQAVLALITHEKERIPVFTPEDARKNFEVDGVVVVDCPAAWTLPRDPLRMIIFNLGAHLTQDCSFEQGGGRFGANRGSAQKLFIRS
jgi:hypothetical protein